MIETNNLAAATPNAFNRRATGDQGALGPLSTLVVGNHWVGDSGFNLMVVPNPTQQFLVMISPLFETHDFIAVPAPAPNRAGVHGTAQIGAVKYSQTVAENVSKNILHEETGMWLNQTPGVGSTAPTPYGLQAVDPQSDAGKLLLQNPIMRSGTIPHGNTVHATGVWQQTDFPQPSTPDLTQYIALSNFQNNGSALNFLPTFVDGSNPASMQDNYISQIAASLKLIGRSDLNPEKFINPIGFLNQRAKNIISLTAMQVTTAGDRGAVINVPFERAFAGPQDFISTFLIETVVNTDFSVPTQAGQDEVSTYFQLQYIQSIPLLFLKGYEGKDVLFPHWNINTLIAI